MGGLIWFGRLRLALLLSIFILPVALSAAEELVVPDDIFYYQSVASVWGQGSVWTNPAALSSWENGRMVMFSQRGKRAVRDWGLSSTMKLSGFAYRHVDYGPDKDLQELIFALGGGRRNSYGVSYRYMKDGPGYLNKRHLWTIGFLSRRSRNLALGARAENLNQGRIEGRRTDIRFVYGLAARAYRNRITVSFDVDQTKGESINQADFRTSIEVRPKPGLYLFADFDNHSRFNLGFRLNFGRSYVGHYHNFDRDAKSVRGTTYIGLIKGNQPSLTALRHRTLTLRLDGRLPENPKIPYLGKRPLKFYDYIDGIYRAADDGNIGRLFINIGSLRCGLGKTEELAEAINYFRSRQKPVTVYLARPNTQGYLVAIAADTVLIPPVSQLPLMGLRAELKTYKGLMDKLGIEAEIERVEEYKTAPERFMFNEPSEPARKQINRILDGLYDYLVESVAVNRRMDPARIRDLIDLAPMTSTEALESGLVDDTCYLDDALKIYAGTGSPIYGRRVSLADYVSRPAYRDHWGDPDRLALVIADGEITQGKSGGQIGQFNMLSAIRRARLDGSVKGVLLRINSPGGSALASDLIWHEVEQTRKVKPVVISMGNVAASGGYYISAVDSPIFVNRSTITGSIGVYAGKVNLSGLFDKIGLYSETLTRGLNAGMYSLSEPFTPRQRQKLKSQITAFYDNFITKVARVRKLAVDSVNALGRGQVWIGTEALKNGLADKVGGVQPALEHLRRLCSLPDNDFEVVVYPRRYFWFDSPFDFPRIMTAAVESVFGENRSILALDNTETDQIFYRMPYNIVIE